MITHGKGEEEYCVYIVKDVMSINEWRDWYDATGITLIKIQSKVFIDLNTLTKKKLKLLEARWVK